ncbi:ABC transporter ATP-binding protein [Zavarzinia sp. CC-PAN008]|uniref:ABC transporter ATP-binding protein n=1 Tax=Zavarzinia sp. CC-PAN008 TaxID=3243332 RepID=UPI003F746450
MPQAEPAVPLALQQVVARYGARVVLHGLDLVLHGGEVYALLGPNGAGKSTIARLACGLLAPAAGRVRVLGQDPQHSAVARRAIGFAPQETALFPSLTIRENLETIAGLARVPAAARRDAVARALDLTACTARGDERVGRLSGGWRRRANLAAALVHRPPLLILDEPTEGVDATTRGVVAQGLRAVVQAGAACLLVSHDAAFVESVADRVGILSAGRMVREGATAALLAQAFQARRVLVLRHDRPPAAAAAVRLRQAGLAPGPDGLSWSGLLEDAVGTAATLAPGGPDAPAEIAIRAPGLDDLVAATLATAEAP